MIPAKKVPHDEKFSQLAVLLNTCEMQKIFQDKLFSGTQNNHEVRYEENRFKILECEIKSVKYKPGKNCMICYQLDIYDTKTKQAGKQILCTRVFEPGGSSSRFEKEQSKGFAVPRFGKPLSYIPDLEMVIWAFPNDRKLEGLLYITDIDYLKKLLLDEIIKTEFGADWVITNLKNEIVHYVPEHTCTVRSHLTLENLQTNKRESIVLYGKAYYNDQGEEAYRVMLQLWESEFRHSGKLMMAQPFGYHKMTKSLWQLGLCGTVLIEQKLDSSALLMLLERAASTVAALHMTTVICSRTIRLNDLLEKLSEVRQLLSECLPSCKKIVDPLIDRLILQSKDLDCKFTGTLHGDLHLQNFFVIDEKVALIDMDNISNGNPLIDIGSFIAGLLYRGMLTDVPDKAIKQLVIAFIQAYKKSVSWEVNKPALNWHVAVALINERVFRCLRRLKSGRLDIVENLLKQADQLSIGAEKIL